MVKRLQREEQLTKDCLWRERGVSGEVGVGFKPAVGGLLLLTLLDFGNSVRLWTTANCKLFGKHGFRSYRSSDRQAQVREELELELALATRQQKSTCFL